MELLVIADDLTGAAAAGARLAGLCGQNLPLTDLDQAAEADDRGGLAVNTGTRAARPREAEAAMAQVARLGPGRRPGIVFKKLDSGLRGPVGPELAALIAAASWAGALVGLTRDQGRLGEGDDYLTPAGAEPEPACSLAAGDARRAILARGHDLEVVPLSLGLVRRGAGAVAAEMARRLDQSPEPVVFLAEGEDEFDLAALALAGLHLKDRLILAGSTGLAAAVGRLAPAARALDGPEIYPARPIIFLAEAAAQGRAAQIDFLVRSGLATVGVMEPRSGSSPPEADKDWAFLWPGGAGGAEAWAGLAARLVADWAPGAVFLSGPQLAPAVWRALKPWGARILGEILPGLVHLEMGSYSLLLQTGGFTDKTLLAHIYGCL